MSEGRIMSKSLPQDAYRRNPDVETRDVDTSLFLASAGDTGVYHLNATGAALWRLLAEPTDLASAVTVLGQAFPDVAREEIEEGVAAIIRDLERKRLVLRVG